MTLLKNLVSNFKNLFKTENSFHSAMDTFSADQEKGFDDIIRNLKNEQNEKNAEELADLLYGQKIK